MNMDLLYAQHLISLQLFLFLSSLGEVTDARSESVAADPLNVQPLMHIFTFETHIELKQHNKAR